MPGKGSQEYWPLSIVTTEQGVIMQGRSHPMTLRKGEPPKVSKRGKIKGWSGKSRQRLREFLVTHGPPEGFSQIGIHLTVPGPPLSSEDQRRLWGIFKDWLVRRGWPVVWRLEVQARGAQHWHTVACVPDRMLEDDIQRAHIEGGCWVPGFWTIAGAWLRALSRLPEVEHPVFFPGFKGKRVVVLRRDHIPGADRRACVVSILPEGKDQRAAKRYLLDHTSKAKQAQIAQGLGRHWGIINRGAWRELIGAPASTGSGEVYYMVLRWLQRLSTPRIADSRDPFGRRAGYPIRRGGVGRAVWFSEPETVRAMVAHARSVVAWRKAERGET